MTCRTTILPGEPFPPCQHPAPSEADPAKLCGGIGHLARVHEGTMLTVCTKHAVEIEQRREPGKSPLAPLRSTPEEDAAEEAMRRAQWDAKQAKLPPGKRRTWEQADADDEAEMGRGLRRASRKGVL